MAVANDSSNDSTYSPSSLVSIASCLRVYLVSTSKIYRDREFQVELNIGIKVSEFFFLLSLPQAAASSRFSKTQKFDVYQLSVEIFYIYIWLSDLDMIPF